MGLATDLGYSHRTANPAQRTLRWFGGTRVGAWFFFRTMRHIDSAIAKVTRGQRTGLLAGLACST